MLELNDQNTYTDEVPILDKRIIHFCFDDDKYKNTFFINSLLRANIHTIGDLVKFSYGDLLDLTGVSTHFINKVDRLLFSFGLRLSEYSKRISFQCHNKYELKILNTPLREVEIASSKTQNKTIIHALERASVFCIGDLLKLADKELLSFRMISRGRLKLIKNFTENFSRNLYENSKTSRK